MNTPKLSSPTNQTHQLGIVSQEHIPSHASCILSAALRLVAELEIGKPLDARIMRFAMEEAFGASDTNGAWIWKDAYEASELAQIKMIDRYGSAMQKNAGKRSRVSRHGHQDCRASTKSYKTLRRNGSAPAILNTPTLFRTGCNGR